MLNGITVSTFMLIYCQILTGRCEMQLCRPQQRFSKSVAMSRHLPQMHQWGLAGAGWSGGGAGAGWSGAGAGVCDSVASRASNMMPG